jgi:uncharacterized protein YggE
MLAVEANVRHTKGNHLKRIMTLVLALTLLYACASVAQESSIVPYITVSGYAEEWVIPDLAVWSINLKNNGTELGDLKISNDLEYQRVLAVAESLGVSADHIATDRINVSKVYDRDKNGNIKNFNHFTLIRLIEIEQHDISLFDEFLNRLLLDGDLDVQMKFKSTVTNEVRDDLRLKATRDARQKAMEIASELSVKVGQPLIISEYPIISDYAQIDRLSKQSGVVMRPTPRKIHFREKIYIRFALELENGTGDGP